MDREHILKTVATYFTCEVDAQSFADCFPNPNGLDYFCAQHNLVYHPNQGTGGFTFWNKEKLAEAEAEEKETENTIRRMREEPTIVGPD